MARLLLLLFSTLAVLLGFELAIHVYVHEIEKYGRIFRSDAELGWSFIPGIDVERQKHGYTYRVITDAAGQRVASRDEPSPVGRWRESSRRKVLVVGDSQAAGRGVDVAYRFDRLLDARRPDWSVLAVGTGGFGPCQEMLLARPYLRDMGPGDVFVLLTTGNDFRDLLATKAAGRAKPRCSLEGGKLAVTPPEIGLRERLRDSSYLGYLLFKRILAEPWRDYSPSERAASAELYDHIVRSMVGDLVPRGVSFVVAHNADWLVWDDGTRDVFEHLGADPRIHELALDSYVLGESLADRDASENLLGDGVHWSRGGHAAVADALEAFLDRPEVAHDPRAARPPASYSHAPSSATDVGELPLASVAGSSSS